MNEDYFFNSSSFDVIHLYWTTFTVYLTDTFTVIKDSNSKLNFVTAINNLPESLNFDDFKWNLLKIFTCLLFINLVLIFCAWAYYGKRICERFMKLTHSNKAIEELKASVSKLKLPKEHTPRI